jgi:hypothetical protein
MSNIGPFVKKANPETFPANKDASPSATESANAEASAPKTSRKRYPEVQSAKRFPIKLPISVKSKTGERHTETQNISANGVLFQMIDSEMPVGSMVDFTISLPADVVGSEADVRLDCRGRVVRSFEDSGRRAIGVVIDEYRFDRAEQRGD